MAGVGRTGKGSAGSDFIATDKIFPGVPYDSSNFNPREKCNSNSGSINNYGDAEQVGSLNAAVKQPYTVFAKGRHKRESKNAKQMRNTKQNCFSHPSVSPQNDKQCSAKQCFANQTNRCLAGFASRSDLFRDNARLTKHRRKVNLRHLILQALYTTM